MARDTTSRRIFEGALGGGGGGGGILGSQDGDSLICSENFKVVSCDFNIEKKVKKVKKSEQEMRKSNWVAIGGKRGTHDSIKGKSESFDVDQVCEI